ncbi:uncharacterized protein TNCV_3960411 [Trichonephila clavipes]|nr:uncharacterized protein TNCV_3960411 [Trichonephila clavipes]
MSHQRSVPRRLLKDEIEADSKKAFQSYLGVVASPPIGFEDFTAKVNKYMQLPPFNFPNPVSSFGGMKKIFIPRLVDIPLCSKWRRMERADTE